MADKWQYLDEAMTASAKKTIRELFAEDPGRVLPVTDGTFTVSFRPFEIVTLRLARKA